MKIYDEISHEEITSPNLSAGYVYGGVMVTGYTEETTEVMEGTVTEDRPEGLVRIVPAKPITEECQYYHKYTEEELAIAEKNYATVSYVDNAMTQAISAAIKLTNGGG